MILVPGFRADAWKQSSIDLGLCIRLLHRPLRLESIDKFELDIIGRVCNAFSILLVDNRKYNDADLRCLICPASLVSSLNDCCGLECIFFKTSASLTRPADLHEPHMYSTGRRTCGKFHSERIV